MASWNKRSIVTPVMDINWWRYDKNLACKFGDFHRKPYPIPDCLSFSLQKPASFPSLSLPLVPMPEIAFETSQEEGEARNSEDDIMSDEEDELRLRQVRMQSPKPISCDTWWMCPPVVGVFIDRSIHRSLCQPCYPRS